MKQKLPRYEMHKYWGKKPPKDLSQLIKKYTNEHDIIMDPFSGYGVFVCESILDNRRAISNDLNPISTFIQKQLLNLKIDIMDFGMAHWEIDQQTDTNGDGVTDTLDTNDGSITCLIDNSGMVHVWFGYAKVFCDGGTGAQGNAIAFVPVPVVQNNVL